MIYRIFHTELYGCVQRSKIAIARGFESCARAPRRVPIGAMTLVKGGLNRLRLPGEQDLLSPGRTLVAASFHSPFTMFFEPVT